MAKLPQGQSGRNEGCALLDRIRMIAAYCGCKTWNEAKHQGGKGNCPLCGGWKLSVGVGRESNVGVSCWSEKCRKDPRARDKIVNRLVAAGFYLGPDRMIEPEASAAPEANGDQTQQAQPAPARKRTRVRMRTVSADQVSGLTPAERRALIWIGAMKADSHGWIPVTQRKIVATCGGSKRDAVPMLRRIQAEHGLIEVQKNGYAKKRPTKVRFTVHRDDLVTALGGYPNAKAIGVNKRPNPNRPETYNGVTMNDGVTTPVNMVSPWNGARHVLSTAIHRQPVGAVDASFGRRGNGGRKTGATVADIGGGNKIATTPVTSGRPALQTRTLRGSETSRRGDVQQGIHPGDHLNQASTAPTSDSNALPLEAEIAERCIPPRETERYIRTREAGSMPARTRETPIHGGGPMSDPIKVSYALGRERALKPTPSRWTLAMIDRLGDTASAHSGSRASVPVTEGRFRAPEARKPPATLTRMPESTLRQQQIENEAKAARHRRAAQNEDQRKV